MKATAFQTYSITLVTGRSDDFISSGTGDDEHTELVVDDIRLEGSDYFNASISTLNFPDGSTENVSAATVSSGDAAFSVDDIEDLVADLVPLDRFKKKDKLSVTDFSAQLWCEKQLEFTLITGRKRVTPSMTAGTARHERLEREDHDVVEVEVYTREDALGLRLLNTITLLQQLLCRGRARELWVFGIMNGVVVRGIIDELELVDEHGVRVENFGSGSNATIVISDTKTRSVPTEPTEAQKRTSAIQLQLYWWMVNALRHKSVDFTSLIKTYKCDVTASFQAEQLQEYVNLASLIKQFENAFSQLPPVSKDLKIVYECQGKTFSHCQIPYSETTTLYALRDLLDWWQGHRESEAVLHSERWKCRRCDFLDMCLASPLDPREIKTIIEEREKQQVKAQLSPSEEKNVNVEVAPTTLSEASGGTLNVLEPMNTRENGEKSSFFQTVLHSSNSCGRNSCYVSSPPKNGLSPKSVEGFCTTRYQSSNDTLKMSQCGESTLQCSPSELGVRFHTDATDRHHKSLEQRLAHSRKTMTENLFSYPAKESRSDLSILPGLGAKSFKKPSARSSYSSTQVTHYKEPHRQNVRAWEDLAKGQKKLQKTISPRAGDNSLNTPIIGVYDKDNDSKRFRTW